MKFLSNTFKAFQFLLLLCLFSIGNTSMAINAEATANHSTEIKLSGNSDTSQVFNHKKFKRLEKNYLTELEKDEANNELNYKLGMLYYDKAESFLNEINYNESSLTELNAIQDSIIIYFKKSLPYMKKGKGHSLNR